jgi:mannose-6-phosphate isomerase-like protein (cupin superfamily)
MEMSVYRRPERRSIVAAPLSPTFQTRQVAEAYDNLAPDGSEIRLLVKGNGGSLCHCTLPAGEVSKATAHGTLEELWYCISGKGQIWRRQGDLEAVVDVKPGVSLSIPTGTTFQFRNTGDDPLCFVIATIPPWPGSEEAIPKTGYWE